jgi:hypothetical protein
MEFIICGISILCFIQFFEYVNMETKYLSEISELKMTIDKKEKEIFSLNSEIEYYKNLPKYNEYLKD